MGRRAQQCRPAAFAGDEAGRRGLLLPLAGRARGGRDRPRQPRPAPDPKDPNWVSVEVEPVRALERPVTLKAIKAEPSLAAMELIRQSRLSVAPVRDEEWARSSRWRRAHEVGRGSSRRTRLSLPGRRRAGTLILTPDGLGPVKIGMTQMQVVAAIGGTLDGEAIESDDICVEKESSALRRRRFHVRGGQADAASRSARAATSPPPRGHRRRRTAAPRSAMPIAASSRSSPTPISRSPAEYLTLLDRTGQERGPLRGRREAQGLCHPRGDAVDPICRGMCLTSSA